MKINVNPQRSLGKYKDPTVYQNNTLRYSPPKDFPEFLAKTLGRAKIMRSFITLDEYRDYRTDTFYPDYAIGVKRYPDEELHYIYDWEMIVPAPSGTRFVDYLTSHAENAEELLLNVRRLEREVSDGIISYDKYEEIFEKAVEYCKELAPNIRYIECCNEVDLKTFGDLTATEYFKIYERAYKAVKRLNEKNNYEIPLLIGGWSVAKPFVRRERWEEFLEILAASRLGDKPIDFYSEHYYDQACSEGLAREGLDAEARALCAVDKLKLLYKRHKQNIKRLGLPDGPYFCNELGRTRTTGVLTDCLRNACGVLTYLIASADSELDGFCMFPWCTFHNPELQISYTQFVLNDNGTYSATPNGMALLMLHKMSGERVECNVSESSDMDARYRAQATRDGEVLYIVVGNTSADEDVLNIEIGMPDGEYTVKRYLCDSTHNNCVTAESNGKLSVTDQYAIKSENGKMNIEAQAEINAFMLFEISKGI